MHLRNMSTMAKTMGLVDVRLGTKLKLSWIGEPSVDEPNTSSGFDRVGATSERHVHAFNSENKTMHRKHKKNNLQVDHWQANYD